MENQPFYKYKLTLAYDGTHYSGWQVQPNGTSIQELVQEKLQLLTREATKVIGSGRTDAGVHALGQTAHFTCSHPLDLRRLLHSLNGLLPKEIRIKEVKEVPDDFHARYSAIGKIYHYYLHLEAIEDPFSRLYRWHVGPQVSIDLLQEGAAFFAGTHDFTSFANEAHRGSAAHDAIRTIHHVNVNKIAGGLCLEFKGNGFLYKMVRNIVGTLIEVALAKRLPSDISAILAAKDRRQAGKAAPPHGLFLVNVDYGKRSF